LYEWTTPTLATGLERLEREQDLWGHLSLGAKGKALSLTSTSTFPGPHCLGCWGRDEKKGKKKWVSLLSQEQKTRKKGTGCNWMACNGKSIYLFLTAT
jgi:hypothetical protein